MEHQGIVHPPSDALAENMRHGHFPLRSLVACRPVPRTGTTVNHSSPPPAEKSPQSHELGVAGAAAQPKKWYWINAGVRSMICGGKVQGHPNREGLSMRLHSAGHFAVGSVLEKPFGLQGRTVDSALSSDESEPIWDPVKAAGGFGLIALLIASAWLEWQLVKWVYLQFV
jgi:hypothetical protein